MRPAGKEIAEGFNADLVLSAAEVLEEKARSTWTRRSGFGMTGATAREPGPIHGTNLGEGTSTIWGIHEPTKNATSSKSQAWGEKRPPLITCIYVYVYFICFIIQKTTF